MGLIDFNCTCTGVYYDVHGLEQHMKTAVNQGLRFSHHSAQYSAVHLTSPVLRRTSRTARIAVTAAADDDDDCDDDEHDTLHLLLSTQRERQALYYSGHGRLSTRSKRWLTTGQRSDQPGGQTEWTRVMTYISCCTALLMSPVTLPRHCVQTNRATAANCGRRECMGFGSVNL